MRRTADSAFKPTFKAAAATQGVLPSRSPAAGRVMSARSRRDWQAATLPNAACSMLLTHWRAPRLEQELHADLLGATCRVLEQAGLLEVQLEGSRRGGGRATAAAVAEGRQGLLPVTGRAAAVSRGTW